MHKKDHIMFAFAGALKPEKHLGGIDHFRILVAQISAPASCEILGVTRATLNRWLNGTRKVPRHAVLALYWESPWGRGLIDSDHMRAINILRHEIGYLRREIKRLETDLIQMEKMGGFGSANSPIYTIKK